MTGRRKGVMAGLAVAVGFLLLGGVWFYYRVVVPNRNLMDLQWYDTVGEEEQLRVAHQVLEFPWGNHHDAFLVVLRMGDARSIPCLLKGLRWQEQTDENKPGMRCTKSHCLDALKRITGHDAGLNYEDWARWWAEEGSSLPTEAFPLGANPRREPSRDGSRAATISSETRP